MSVPGGCVIGFRPIDLHIKGFKALGAKVETHAGYVCATAKKLTGARMFLGGAFGSTVLGTANVMMAATLAEGTTIIENAACEPEVENLANALIAMGAEFKGGGTPRVEVRGVKKLVGTTVELIPDRIEAGTFLVAGAITGGSVTLTGVNPEHISAVLSKLEDAGCRINVTVTTVALQAPSRLHPVDVTAAIFPGFPTDMQAQWIALMAVAGGASVVTDTIYFDRFKHVPELLRLGADIEMKENSAIVRGVKRLTGATVMSTDLRASASLILAGLVAEGTTEVLRVYHIDRGYEAIEMKFRALGADIERVSGQEF